MAVKKRIVVVGDDTCGKTALLNVFSKGLFPENHAPTAWENYTKEIQLDNEKLDLVMVDTAGDEEYDRFRPLFYRDADVILICFSIGSQKTLENVLVKWKPEARHFCPQVPIILVGTKVDLRKFESKSLHENATVNPGSLSMSLSRNPVHHLVSCDQGKSVAETIRALAYIECSARSNEGVQQLFELATKAASDRIFSPTPSPIPSSPPCEPRIASSSQSTQIASPSFTTISPQNSMEDYSDSAFLIPRENVEDIGSRLGLSPSTFSHHSCHQYQNQAQYQNLSNGLNKSWTTCAKFSLFLVPFLLLLILAGVTIAILQDAGIFTFSKSR